ncbi:hypothetical protein B0H16DRAFT_1600340 [Mycena metata]|uniref:Uncharacterized protein n=1 Tax=Mycena metata TaxID=1033252 RepID=A0AAD7HK17_9AGAR|nr:hypothetical protein B0H16DRAFT_1600340 [Mycena metata]
MSARVRVVTWRRYVCLLNEFTPALMPRLMGINMANVCDPNKNASLSPPPFSHQKPPSSIAIRNTPLVTMPTASTSSGSPSALSISSIVHGAKYDDAQNNVSFKIIATVITSPKTLAGFFKIFGHDKDCQGCPCPLHVPGPIVKIERAFRIYVGALVSLSDEHGYLRFKPWGVRLFSSLAKLALLGIRPNAFDEEPRKTLKTPKDDGGNRKKKIIRVRNRAPLGDATNTLSNPQVHVTASPAEPTTIAPPATTASPSTVTLSESSVPSVNVYSLDPSVSLSPESCAERRRARMQARKEFRQRISAGPSSKSKCTTRKP